jgi:hypothetical protein
MFMGLLVILGTLGIVNGLWSKNLVINGTVSTGDLNADWDCGYTNDDGAVEVIQGGGCDTSVVEPDGDTGADPNNYNWPNFIDNDPFVRKDVAECDLEIGDHNTGEGSFGDQIAYVTIHNAYPSYECTITLYLTNTGSIPFNIVGANLTMEEEAEGIIETVNAAGVDLCDVDATEDTQVDPGNELAFSCTVHVSELAAQNVCTGTTAQSTTTPPFPVITETCTNTPLPTYDFAINVCVAQWNEETTYENCKNPDPGTHEGPEEVTFPD